MVAGHLDEIGFIVTKIDNNGFIKFQPIGGWWNQVMLSQKVTITTDDVLKSVVLSVQNHHTSLIQKNVRSLSKLRYVH